MQRSRQLVWSSYPARVAAAAWRMRLFRTASGARRARRARTLSSFDSHLWHPLPGRHADDGLVTACRGGLAPPPRKCTARERTFRRAPVRRERAGPASPAARQLRRPRVRERPRRCGTHGALAGSRPGTCPRAAGARAQRPRPWQTASTAAASAAARACLQKSCSRRRGASATARGSTAGRRLCRRRLRTATRRVSPRAAPCCAAKRAPIPACCFFLSRAACSSLSRPRDGAVAAAGHPQPGKAARESEAERAAMRGVARAALDLPLGPAVVGGERFWRASASAAPRQVSLRLRRKASGRGKCYTTANRVPRVRTV